MFTGAFKLVTPKSGGSLGYVSGSELLLYTAMGPPAARAAMAVAAVCSGHHNKAPDRGASTIERCISHFWEMEVQARGASVAGLC